MPDVPFTCRCGTVRGRLTDVGPDAGARIVCHCRDCRAAEVALGQSDPGPAGVDLYQTTPDRVVFEAGADRLALLRLSPTGLFRWHAACCGSPLFNTTTRPGAAFASLHVGRAADPAPFGPVRAELSGSAKRNRGLAGVIVGVFWRMARCRLSGRWRLTPFFDAAGAPVAAPRILSLAERQAATPAT